MIFSFNSFVRFFICFFLSAWYWKLGVVFSFLVVLFCMVLYCFKKKKNYILFRKYELDCQLWIKIYDNQRVFYDEINQVSRYRVMMPKSKNKNWYTFYFNVRSCIMWVVGRRTFLFVFILYILTRLIALNFWKSHLASLISF